LTSKFPLPLLIHKKQEFMKTTMKFLSLVIVLVTFTFTSCSKEGESGPMGQAGANGTNGLDGIDGQDGEDGNANVMPQIGLSLPRVPLVLTIQDIRPYHLLQI
jgi:hypothetical protein